MNEMKRRMKQMEIKQQGKEVVKQFDGIINDLTVSRQPDFVGWDTWKEENRKHVCLLKPLRLHGLWEDRAPFARIITFRPYL